MGLAAFTLNKPIVIAEMGMDDECQWGEVSRGEGGREGRKGRGKGKGKELKEEGCLPVSWTNTLGRGEHNGGRERFGEGKKGRGKMGEWGGKTYERGKKGESFCWLYSE